LNWREKTAYLAIERRSMTKTWDAVNATLPPPVGHRAARRFLRANDDALLCCTATRGLAFGDDLFATIKWSADPIRETVPAGRFGG
jgi:hypothetical protein